LRPLRYSSCAAVDAGGGFRRRRRCGGPYSWGRGAGGRGDCAARGETDDPTSMKHLRRKNKWYCANHACLVFCKYVHGANWVIDNIKRIRGFC
jgi:hypothetical protein